MDEYSYVVNVDGVVVRDGEYLLIERGADEEHAPGMLAFPGGKVEQAPGTDDPIEATATREIHEEVGVEVGQVEYVMSRTFEADDGTACINILTVCEYERGEPFPRASEEVADVHWMTAEEILARDPPAYLRGYVEQIEAYPNA